MRALTNLIMLCTVVIVSWSVGRVEGDVAGGKIKSSAEKGVGVRKL